MHLEIDANVHRGFVTKLYLEIVKKIGRVLFHFGYNNYP